MTNRLIMGARNGLTGIYLSKPGVDVLSAVGDQLMMDRDSFIYQPVEAGFHALGVIGTTNGNPSAFGYGATFPLQSASLSGLSRVYVWTSATFDYDPSDSDHFDAKPTGYSIKQLVSNGQLTIQVGYAGAPYHINSRLGITYYWQVTAAYAVFRGRY
jgi:hypothetical protein